jgi:hypothetical protein
MNATLARARGRYVAILNSDDYALPDRLERQVAVLEARPATGAVFTAVRIVDERGETVRGPSPFDAPLSFADQRRSTWLRHFFFHGNCLCAPSGMIRREAFFEIGTYDRRLTNLQDLDVWVRLAAKWDIDFLADPLTAFRVRDGLLNLSAPRRDTVLRSQFEMCAVLRRFFELDRDLVFEMLGSRDSRMRASARSKKRALALAALDSASAPHRFFGAQTLHDIAKTTADYRELAELTGSMVLFQSGFNDLAIPVDRFCIVADGVPIEPAETGDRWRFELPANVCDVYLASPTRAPGASGSDQRRLGIAIFSIVVRDRTGERELDLCDPGLRDGFHPPETDQRGTRRWTNGFARLPSRLLGDRRQPITIMMTGSFTL